MNVFSFSGNLGKDCEVKSLQSGTTVCEFSVAVASGYGDKKKTSWIRCALFGKRAEGKLPEYLKKGAQVAVSGELTVEEWEKDGQKHTMVKVNVNSLDLIGGRSEAPIPARTQPQAAPAGESFDDDIPF